MGWKLERHHFMKSRIKKQSRREENRNYDAETSNVHNVVGNEANEQRSVVQTKPKKMIVHPSKVVYSAKTSQPNLSNQFIQAAEVFPLSSPISKSKSKGTKTVPSASLAIKSYSSPIQLHGKEFVTETMTSDLKEIKEFWEKVDEEELPVQEYEKD